MSKTEIHTTDRTTFKKCRQLWDFSSNLRMNLEPIRPYEPFWFGTAFHAGLAAYYDPDAPQQRSVEAAKTAFIPHVEKWFKGLDEPASEDIARRDELLAMGLSMMEQYGAFAKANDNFDVMWIEKEFVIPIPGLDGYEYSLRVDGLVMDSKGNLWLLEHKTAASFPGETDYLLMDDQVGSYIWAIQQAIGEEITGVIYNWVKKKIPVKMNENKNGSLSVDKSQDTTYEIALAQITEKYGTAHLEQKYRDFLTHLQLKENNFVRREITRRNRKEIAMLGQSLPAELRDMVDEPAIYRSPSRFNCNGCPFFAPCLLKWEQGNYEELLESSYTQRKRED